MTPNDELPQNICPFCLHQIKTTYYFILKCQESDRKLRLSLSNSSVKNIEIANVDDEFIDNEASEFECIVGEDSNVQIDKEGSELNKVTSILESEQQATDEPCIETAKYFFLKRFHSLMKLAYISIDKNFLFWI